MDTWELHRIVDLSDVRRCCMVTDRVYAALGSARPMALNYDLRNGAFSAELTGASVTVYGKRPDGTTVLAAGKVNGHEVTAALGEQFYALVGDVECSVRLTTGDVDMPLARLILRVVDAPHEHIIDPGEELEGLSEGLQLLSTLPELTLTEAEVPGVVKVRRTGADAWSVLMSDGAAYTLVADGENISIEEVDA